MSSIAAGGDPIDFATTLLNNSQAVVVMMKGISETTDAGNSAPYLFSSGRHL
jgi:hypothetical protein